MIIGIAWSQCISLSQRCTVHRCSTSTERVVSWIGDGALLATSEQGLSDLLLFLSSPLSLLSQLQVQFFRCLALNLALALKFAFALLLCFALLFAFALNFRFPLCQCLYTHHRIVFHRLLLPFGDCLGAHGAIIMEEIMR